MKIEEEEAGADEGVKQHMDLVVLQVVSEAEDDLTNLNVFCLRPSRSVVWWCLGPCTQQT